MTPARPGKRGPKGSSAGRMPKKPAGRARPAAGKHAGAAGQAGAPVVVGWGGSDLLERARMQWQFGDWEGLVEIDGPSLELLGERADLAALIAGAYQQRHDLANARRLLGLARDWGCDQDVIARILVAGVHNTLGRAASVSLQGDRAFGHFLKAVDGAGGDSRLACQARAIRELARLGMHGHAVELIERQLRVLPETLQDQTSMWPLAAPDDRLSVRMQAVAERCMTAGDVHAAVDAELDSPGISRDEAFALCVALADGFAARKDKMTAVHFVNTARQHMAPGDRLSASTLARKLLALGQPAPALDLLITQAIRDSGLGQPEKSALDNAYANVRMASASKAEHGHVVLLDYLRAHHRATPPLAGGRKPLLVEIGSTRENVPGQGSTRVLAEYCKSVGIDFISVDMDPHNTASAAKTFDTLGTTFRAVNAKGEDFLCAFDGEIDFAFLDAYDFDHGGHSALRQSRYEKFLGARIDELACHQMHLECAESLRAKLSPTGVICIDDTWLDDGKWCAKGTLAVPFLVENGFEVIEARNRAALLRRIQPAEAPAASAP